MDYHFYQSKSPQKSADSSVNVKRVFLYFLPVFMMAAILPALVGLVRRPTETEFSAQAGQNELTLWIEPANSEVTHGKPVTLTVMGLFDSESKLLPGVEIPVEVTGPAAIQNATVTYGLPFRGQVTLGAVTVLPQKAGTVTVSINPKTVKSGTFTDPLPIVVSSAVILVK